MWKSRKYSFSRKSSFYAVCPDSTPVTVRCWNVTQNFTFAFVDENMTSAVFSTLNSSITDGTLQQLLAEVDSSVYVIMDSSAPTPAPDVPVAAITATTAVAGSVALLYLLILPGVFIFYFFYVLRKTVVAVKFEDKSEIKSKNWRKYAQRCIQRVEGRLKDSYGEDMILYSDIEEQENGAAQDGEANESRDRLERVAFKLNCEHTPENHKAFLRFLGQPPYEVHPDNVSLTWKGSLNVLVRMKSAQAEEAFASYVSEGSLSFSVDDSEVFVDSMAPVVQAKSSSLYEIIKGKAGGNTESDVTLYKQEGIDLFIPNTMGGGVRLGAIPYYREVKKTLFCSEMKPHPSILTVDEDTVLVRKSERDLITQLRGEGFREQPGEVGQGSGYLILRRSMDKPEQVPPL